MSIKAGQVLHDAQGFVIDRIQTGGVSNLNIPQEKVYELGNFESVATIRDIPDLSFDIESLDVSTEIEALICNLDPGTVANGDQIDFGNSVPLDIISPFKADKNLYNIVKGIIIPYLTLESVTYRFGTTTDATEAFTLRGDAVYYIPGSPYYEEFAGDGSTATFTLAHTAIPYKEAGNTTHVVGLCITHSDGTYQRLFYGTDYTDSTTTFTLVNPTAVGTGVLKALYGSTTAATYPQSLNADVSVKPGAVRGKDIDIYIGTGPIRTITGSITSASNVITGTGYTSAMSGGAVDGVGIPPGTTVTFTDATHLQMSANAISTHAGESITFTPPLLRWTGIQSFEATRRVNLDADREFGNSHYVAQDYVTADVTGSIGVRSRDVADLWTKIAQVTNVSTTEVAGVLSSVGFPMEARIRDPETGTLLKTIYVPDARFEPPPVQGRASQKIDVTFSYQSDKGLIYVYKGARVA